MEKFVDSFAKLKVSKGGNDYLENVVLYLQDEFKNLAIGLESLIEILFEPSKAKKDTTPNFDENFTRWCFWRPKKINFDLDRM